MNLRAFIIGACIIHCCICSFSYAQKPILADSLPKGNESLIGEAAEQLNIKKRQINEYSVDIEIDQLMINQTITKWGNDFYEMFYSKWNWPQGSDNFIIQFNELPFRTTTTRIEVVVNDFKVFEAFLNPRTDALEAMVYQASNLTFNYISNYNQIIRDLEGEDQLGSGIY